MEFTAKLLLLLTLKWLICSPFCAEYYVKPTLDTKCSEQCYTLSHYISNSQHYFVSNVTFHFLPGIFFLESNQPLSIGKITSFSLIGSERYTIANLTNGGYQHPIPVSEIECIGRTGIVFSDGSDVMIKQLRIRNCHVGLGFNCIKDASIFHVLIENSNIAGIFGYRMLGNNSIADSTFIKSTLNFEYTPVPCQISLAEVASTSRVEIDRTYIFYGYQDPQHVDAGGLSITIKGYPLEILVRVTDTVFFKNHGRRGGNMAVYVFQTSAELDRRITVLVKNCSFVKGSAHEGGGLALFVEGQCDNTVDLQTSTFLRVSSSYFLLNHATTNESKCEDYYCGLGGGVYITFSSNCSPVEVSIDNCSFIQNIADIHGAGICIEERTYSTVINLIRISNRTVFEGGSAGRTGGGIRYITEVIPMPSKSGNLPPYLPINLQLLQTSFSENTAGMYGGALSMIFQGAKQILNQIPRLIELTNCDIHNNSAGIHGASSVTIHSTHSSSSRKVVLTNVSICCQGDILLSSEKVLLSRVFEVTNMDAVQFINCSFCNNKQTALVALASNLEFYGTVLFVNNHGQQGGALGLYESFIYVHNNTLLVFRDNTASWHGGGIFVAQRSSILIPYPCFFQVSTADFTPIHSLNIHIVMENNAASAGSAIYGGSVDFCWSQSVLLDDKRMPYPGGKWLFDSIFEIIASTPNDTSVISSDALDVCFCENRLPQCDVRLKNSTPTYPGAKVSTSVITVGQRNGTTPGAVGVFVLRPNEVKIPSQTSAVYGACLEVIREIYTLKKTVKIHYTAARSSLATERGVQLLISLLDCPPGFILTPNGSCDCVPILSQHRINCTIDGQSIHRIAPLWIGYHLSVELDVQSNGTAYEHSNSSEEDGTIVHEHCPFNYCKPGNVDILLNDTDEQCANNHSGVLCGACKPGFSVVFGSLRCLACSSAYLALVLVFAVAGIALVALLTLCDLTVSEGTLNGLVFYANVVQANNPTFFPKNTSQFHITFIAWLNLDLGIETCFYNGMDMYAKAWLQFVFPVYIWLLVVAIIVSSNYSITAAKLAGRNAPKVLSTLFLLSNARILRAVITTFSFTILSLPGNHNNQLVWLYDGNINYLSGKHIPLFTVGLLFTVLFLIPYTLMVCFIQHLQHHSSFRLLHWVQRLKPLLDAYTGPYKDKYRFWTGLLLLVRAVLFLAIAVNALGDPSLNLLLVIVTGNCLLALEWIFRGIYKEWPFDILEASCFLNLSILSAATLYVRFTGGNQVAITSTSTGIAFATFIGILIYHTYHRITKSVCWRRLKQFLRMYLKTHSTQSHEIEPLATGTGSSSNDSDTEGIRLEPCAKIQPLRLTFNTDDEPVLIAVSGNHARVQRQTIDHDEESVLVVQDTLKD